MCVCVCVCVCLPKLSTKIRMQHNIFPQWLTGLTSEFYFFSFRSVPYQFEKNQCALLLTHILRNTWIPIFLKSISVMQKAIGLVQYLIPFPNTIAITPRAPPIMHTICVCVCVCVRLCFLIVVYMYIVCKVGDRYRVVTGKPPFQ